MYYITHRQHLKNGQVAVAPTTEKENIDEALSVFFDNLAYDTKSVDVLQSINRIEDTNGNTVKFENWIRTVTSPVTTE